ncbi:MAG: hypothetical protein ACXACP_08220 [Candidatus Hodarchaeales archaeon]
MKTIVFRNESISGIPIPWEEEFPVYPYPKYYNGSIFFESEHIYVIFDETEAKIEAEYSFKNPSDTSNNLSILIPFKYVPEISIILLDGKIINYEWRNLTNEYSTRPYDLYWFKSSYFIRLNLDFNASETKILKMNYSSNYTRGSHPHTDAYDYYQYEHFVGPLRFWNHSLETAEYEFMVPKTISDKVPYLYSRPYSLGNNTKIFTANDTHYSINLKYENLTIPPLQIRSQFWESRVGIGWEKSKSNSIIPLFVTAFILVISLACLIIIMVRRQYK